MLCAQIQRVWDENLQVYGVRKDWRQLRREGFQVARWVVERRMDRLGPTGVVHGKKPRSTLSDRAAPSPAGSRQLQVNHRQSWRSREAVELATLTWVEWCNNRRLRKLIGSIAPAEV